MATGKRVTSKYYPGGEDFEVTEFPFYWITRLHAKYGLELEKKLKVVGLDVSRWRVAMLLRAYGEMSISRIAEEAHGKLPTITKIVYRMQDEGLVLVRQSESDGRISVVSLTARGAEVVDQVNGSTKDLFKRLFKGVSEAQIRRLNETLALLLGNLSD
ncbi:MarR family winged helix-turn-helix transcriptional regulator [Rhodospirillum sp. A1_3_36]|uniref:MarR family winged helix-turn-helix transcriptional regulator n=1 Tax=Rhodospirillum sp. A1_3_36 TaxID=3391666 RepID=UPI0039A62789